jgi:hypothetical protein
MSFTLTSQGGERRRARAFSALAPRFTCARVHGRDGQRKRRHPFDAGVQAGP